MGQWNRRTFLNTSLFAGAGVLGSQLRGLGILAAGRQTGANFPEEILNPVEVSGEEAVPIIGRLPGARRMYMLPADQGEFHVVGSQVIKRISRSQETSGVAGVHEATSFSGRNGAAMPRHRHLTSHAALLVLLGGK